MGAGHQHVQRLLLDGMSLVIETEVLSPLIIKDDVGPDPGLVVLRIGVHEVAIDAAKGKPAVVRIGGSFHGVAHDFGQGTAEVDFEGKPGPPSPINGYVDVEAVALGGIG
jgi:hypothetical protein